MAQVAQYGGMYSGGHDLEQRVRDQMSVNVAAMLEEQERRRVREAREARARELERQARAERAAGGATVMVPTFAPPTNTAPTTGTGMNISPAQWGVINAVLQEEARRPQTMVVHQPSMAAAVKDYELTNQVNALTANVSKMADTMANFMANSNQADAEHRRVLEHLVAQQYRESPYRGQAGAMGFYNRDAGLGSAGRMAGTPYKGGVIVTDLINVPDDAAAGTVVINTFTGNELARMLGTVACDIKAYVGPGPGNVGGQLLVVPERVRLEFLINGQNTLFTGVPLATIINNADGSEKAAPLNVALPEFASVTVRATVAIALGGVAGQFSSLFIACNCADACMASGKVPIPPHSNTQALNSTNWPDSRALYNQAAGYGSCGK